MDPEDHFRMLDQDLRLDSFERKLDDHDRLQVLTLEKLVEMKATLLDMKEMHKATQDLHKETRAMQKDLRGTQYATILSLSDQMNDLQEQMSRLSAAFQGEEASKTKKKASSQSKEAMDTVSAGDTDYEVTVSDLEDVLFSNIDDNVEDRVAFSNFIEHTVPLRQPPALTLQAALLNNSNDGKASWPTHTGSSSNALAGFSIGSSQPMSTEASTKQSHSNSTGSPVDTQAQVDVRGRAKFPAGEPASLKAGRRRSNTRRSSKRNSAIGHSRNASGHSIDIATVLPGLTTPGRRRSGTVSLSRSASDQSINAPTLPALSIIERRGGTISHSRHSSGQQNIIAPTVPAPDIVERGSSTISHSRNASRQSIEYARTRAEIERWALINEVFDSNSGHYITVPNDPSLVFGELTPPAKRGDERKDAVKHEDD